MYLLNFMTIIWFGPIKENCPMWISIECRDRFWITEQASEGDPVIYENSANLHCLFTARRSVAPYVVALLFSGVDNAAPRSEEVLVQFCSSAAAATVVALLLLLWFRLWWINNVPDMYFYSRIIGRLPPRDWTSEDDDAPIPLIIHFGHSIPSPERTNWAQLRRDRNS